MAHLRLPHPVQTRMEALFSSQHCSLASQALLHCPRHTALLASPRRNHPLQSGMIELQSGMIEPPMSTLLSFVLRARRASPGLRKTAD